ncbi:hypothetical protein BH23BAC3_BH23BAC3_34270 [soil metagenome]
MYIQASTVKRKGKDGRNRKLVESYRDPETGQPRNRTVRTLETLPLLERARLIWQHGGGRHLDAEEWLALEQAGDLSAPEIPTGVGDTYAGAGSAVVAAQLRQSGLGEILRKALGRTNGRLVAEMIGLQMLRPASKLAYSASRRQTLRYLLDGKKQVPADGFYRALDGLAGEFEKVRQSLNDAHPPRGGRVLLYDLSNSYFCGTKAELGGYGHSKEKRHDRYIVSYGLVMSEDHLPLDIRLWKGGTPDNKTVLETFRQWKQAYQAEEAVWVADRSMSDEQTLSQVEQLGLSYVTGLPGSAQKALLGQLHESQPDLFDQALSEFDQDGQRCVLCRHQKKGYRRQAQRQRARRTVYDGLRAIQRSPQNKDRDKLYHRAVRLLERHKQTAFWSIDFDENTDAKGDARYRLRFTLDRQAAQAADAVGHYYLLQTNLSPRQADAGTIQGYYKSLMMVERSFRQAKTDLEIRPIRHWKKSRITGHIYLNYLCLWLLTYIERQWRSLGHTQEVAPTLRRWDDALRYVELIDQENQTSIGFRWSKGEQAKRAIEEIDQLGERDNIQPQL